MQRHSRIRSLALAVATLAAAGLPAAAQSTWTVNDFRDLPDHDLADGVIDGDAAAAGAQVTLRAAIMQVGAWGGSHTILLPAGVFALDRWGTDDAARWGDLDVHGVVQLTVRGIPMQTFVDAQALAAQGFPDRVFDLPPGGLLPGALVRIEDLVLRSGSVVGVGGGVRHASGQLTLVNVAIDGCSSHAGGGIHTNGVLAMSGGRLSGCFVSASGGLSGRGGGIFAAPGASLTLDAVEVSGCGSADHGAGVRVDAGAGLDARDCTFTGDLAGSSGGALSVAGTAGLTDCRLTANGAVGSGGGVAVAFGGSATLVRTRLLMNHAGIGGGAQVAATGSLVAAQCTFDQNQALTLGGGLSLSGIAHLDACTVSRNAAPRGGGLHDFGELHAVNTTISSNTADEGGGVYLLGLGTATSSFSACTIAFNTAQLLGAGVRSDDVYGAPLHAFASVLLSDNRLANGQPQNFWGPVQPLSLGFNLDSDGTSGVATCDDVQGAPGVLVQPALAPLLNNGGPTETHALLQGSIAIDRGGCTAFQGLVLASDQRGQPRVAPCDIGAYEAALPATGLPAAYCTAKPTSIPGCVAQLTWTGRPRWQDPACFSVAATPAPGASLGVFFWGTNGPAAQSFLGGTLCVAPPLVRSAPKASGGTFGACNGGYALSGTELGPLWQPGQTLHLQCWFRDAGDPFGSGLSDGVTFLVL